MEGANHVRGLPKARSCSEPRGGGRGAGRGHPANLTENLGLRWVIVSLPTFKLASSQNCLLSPNTLSVFCSFQPAGALCSVFCFIFLFVMLISLFHLVSVHFSFLALSQGRGGGGRGAASHGAQFRGRERGRCPLSGQGQVLSLDPPRLPLIARFLPNPQFAATFRESPFLTGSHWQAVP